MLIKPLTIINFLSDTYTNLITSINVVNPLILLIVPIIGSLIILSYPFI